MKAPEQITLPAFLRRTIKAYALKAEIRRIGCELQRKGRSRNWLLTATRDQMREVIAFIDSAGEDSWLWLGKLLQTKLVEWTDNELSDLVRANPQITVNELIAKTDCTVAQARKIIDMVEWES